MGRTTPEPHATRHAPALPANSTSHTRWINTVDMSAAPASRPPRPLPPEPASPTRPKQALPPPTTPSGPRPNPSSHKTSTGGANPQTALAPPKTPSSAGKSPRHGRFRSALPLPPVVEGDSHLLRDVRAPLPGDPGTGVKRRGSSPTLAKQRSAYFEKEFGGERREGSGGGQSVRDRSIVVAEVKTNVFIKDETAFLGSLSDHLTHRYSRPITSIAATLQHGACLLLGGTFDPAYIVTISAIPSLLQPATNKRNAALLQKHLEMTLGVRSDRGVVRFVPIGEDCLARGGRTVAADVGEHKGVDGAIHRRRTIRTFSRLKPGWQSTTSPPPPVPDLPKTRTHVRSASASSVQLEGSRPNQQTEGSRAGAVFGESPKGKELKQKGGMNFVQNIFRRASKAGRGEQAAGHAGERTP